MVESLDDLVEKGYEIVPKNKDVPPLDLGGLAKKYGKPVLEGVVVGVLMSSVSLVLKKLDVPQHWPTVEFPLATACVGSLVMNYTLNKVSDWWSEVYNSRQNNRTINKITKTLCTHLQNEEDSRKYSVKSFSAYTTVLYLGFKFIS